MARVATEERPIWLATPEDPENWDGLWMVQCDEGWRISIAASGLYRWAAEWMAEVLDEKPFAPGRRP